LSQYLKKAVNLKSSGESLSVVGSTSALLGIFLAASGGSTAYLGAGMIVVGLVCTLVGVPMMMTVYSMEIAITEVLCKKNNTTMIDLIPSSIYNFQSRNIQPGLTPRVSF
jgi:hypothetical protein